MKRTVITTKATIIVKEQGQPAKTGEITVVGNTTEIVTRNAKKALGFKTRKDGETRQLIVLDEERHATLYELDDRIFFENATIIKDEIITEEQAQAQAQEE